MNQILEAQLNRHNIPEELKHQLSGFLSEVSGQYSKYEGDIQKAISVNKTAQQETNINTGILYSLRSAIAVLQPNSNFLSTHDQENLNEPEYLVKLLIRLIEEEKKKENNLRIRSIQLEKLNQMLQREKESLAMEKAKDQAILFAIGEGLVVVNMQGKIVLTNSMSEVILGKSSREFIGKDYYSSVPKLNKEGKQIPFEERFYKRVIDTMKVVRSEPGDYHYYLRPDGTRIPVVVTAAPIRIGTRTIGIVEVFRDITQDLEMDKAKIEFVSLASHQLRTPLSSINWYTEMLLDEVNEDKSGKFSDEQKMFIREVATANNKMVKLVNALLNVSSIDLKTYTIETEEMDLRVVLDIVLNELAPQIAIKKLHVSKNVYDLPSNGIVIADPKIIKIIFQNIISNAIKYTPVDGSVRITLTGQKNTGDFLFAVEDTGYGIPENQRDKVFTKLFRADNIQKKDTDGNGLGLYIVKSILDNIGGRIWYESVVDEGTKFYVEFPKEGMRNKQGIKSLRL